MSPTDSAPTTQVTTPDEEEFGDMSGLRLRDAMLGVSAFEDTEKGRTGENDTALSQDEKQAAELLAILRGNSLAPWADGYRENSTINMAG